MKILRTVSEREVWQHWQKVEGHQSSDFRSDIRGVLPKDLSWHLCQIERQDISKFYIISSEDWRDISAHTYRALDVVQRFRLNSENPDAQRLATDILQKVAFLNSGGQLDTRLIAVTDSPSLLGPYTFLEGNRRLVAFMSRNSVEGSEIYLGHSLDVRHYWWARKTYCSRSPSPLG